MPKIQLHKDTRLRYTEKFQQNSQRNDEFDLDKHQMEREGDREKSVVSCTINIIRMLMLTKIECKV